MQRAARLAIVVPCRGRSAPGSARAADSGSPLRRAARVSCWLAARSRRAHELHPDSGAAFDGAFDTPAFAEGLHEVESEAAALGVGGARGDRAAAAGIVDVDSNAVGPERDAHDDACAGGH